MSTPFKPIEIPPGVVSTATKKQRSSNWSEVNLIRWREGQLMPMGGQAQLSNVVGGVEKYKFASRCKRIHGWFGLDGAYRIAYLCEAHLYVDVGGVLTDISPTPAACSACGFGRRLRRRTSTTTRSLRHAARDPDFGRHHQDSRRLQPR